MVKERSNEILGIALINLLLGVFLILLGTALAFFNQFLGEYDFYDLSHYAMRTFLAIIGGLSILAGLISVFLFVGLMLMKDWARLYSIVFFISVGIFSVVLMFMNFYLGCTIISFVVVIICVFSVLFLRKASVIRTFESYELEISKRRFIDSKSEVHETMQDKILESRSVEVEVKVPENMMLCPQCNALNLRKDEFCKTCATELNPEEETNEETSLPEEEITQEGPPEEQIKDEDPSLPEEEMNENAPPPEEDIKSEDS
jgi:hypothetical protein